MPRGARPPDLSQESSIFGRDRRRVQRHRAHIPAYANLSGSAQGAVLDLCEILNISESGMCIQVASQMKTNRLLPLSLDLSETGARLHIVGHVVWSEASGKTGIRFPEMSEGNLAQLRQWLNLNTQAESTHGAIVPQDEDAPKSRVQPKPGSAVAYTSLVGEWSEIQKEVEGCGPDLEPALHILVQRALTMTWATGTAIALVNKSRPSEMICRARAGTDSPELGARLESGSGFSGECVRSGQAIVCDDTEYDKRVDRRSCRALGIRSILACPIKHKDEVIGIIEVFSPEPAAFWENDITILRKLADIVAGAVRRAQHSRADVLSFPPGDQLADDSSSANSSLLSSYDHAGAAAAPSLRSRILILAAGMICITGIIWVLAPSIIKFTSSTSEFASLPAAEADSSPDTYSSLGFPDVKKLASSGNVGAEYALGMRFANGDGTRQDYREAMQWFLRAADAGNVRAQARVAAWFWAGRGAPQDNSKAYYWALLAQAGGDEAGSAIVMQTAPALSPARVAAEQKAAEQWLHAHHIGHPSDSD